MLSAMCDSGLPVVTLQELRKQIEQAQSPRPVFSFVLTLCEHGCTGQKYTFTIDEGATGEDGRISVNYDGFINDVRWTPADRALCSPMRNLTVPAAWRCFSTDEKQLPTVVDSI